MTIALDHLLWATPDLDRGATTIEALAGVAPGRGGSHPGFGTRNSLLSLGEIYLELIAPDPAQSLAGNRGGAIAAMTGPGLITFAVRTDDLGGYGAAAARAGVTVQGPVAMSRTRPDGVRLDWACIYVEHPVYGDTIPFAIDWRGSPHPSATTPPGCTLREFVVLHPRPEALAELYRALEVPVTVRGAASPGFLATIVTPKGDIVLTNS